MSAEFVAEAGKVFIGAVAGGLVTAASALPYLNSRITKLTTEVSAMKESCAICRSGLDSTVNNLAEKVTSHHEDDEKHYTKASDRLLNDILVRVMRIENRLFNGHSRPPEE